MVHRAAKYSAALVTGLCVLSSSLLGCTPSTSQSPTVADPTDTSEQQITLTVSTFNTFGYKEAGLYDEYTRLHPNITIREVRAATVNQARDNMKTKLAAGSGLSDVEAIEVDWLPELAQSPDYFTDMSSSDVAGRWADYVTKPATVGDKLLGYATDVGPEAICYRQDLFKRAGLPSDPTAVAELLGGAKASWDTYFEVGRQFVAQSESAWYDSAGSIYQAMSNQQANMYEQADGTPTDLASNTVAHSLYTQVAEASVNDGLSAHLGQWSDDWNAAFQNDGFATMVCPAWMTTVIASQAKGVTGWNIADVFPGGGGNWGGSYLTVPAQGAHPAEAKALAQWLTAPEQAVKVFTQVGNFPSQTAAQKDPTVLDATQQFFNDAPTGKIFTNRAAAVTVIPFKGPSYFAVQDVVSDALTRVDIEKSMDAETSWRHAIEKFNELDLR